MKLAEIFVAVRPDARELPRDMRRALDGANVDKLGHDQGDKFSRGFGQGLGRLAAGVGAALGGLAIGRKLKESVTAASDLNETVSKTQQIFGKSSAAVLAFADKAPTALGQSKRAALDANSTFGLFGKTAGLSGQKLVGFTTNLTSLAGDLASFNNTSPEQAIEALGAALRGENEPIRAYGVLLDDATLKAEGMRLGLVKATTDTGRIQAAQIRAEVAQRNYNKAVKEHGKDSTEAKTASAGLLGATNTLKKLTEGTIPPLTQQQKVLAANSVIFRQTTAAQGDFARTSAGLANQQRIAAAQTDKLKVAIGNALLPVVLSGATVLNKQLLPPLIALAEKHGPHVAATLQDIATRAGPAITDFFSGLGPKIKSFADGTNEASPALASLSTSARELGPVVKDLHANVPSLADALNVAATAASFFAEHTDTLRKLMPVLVVAFTAYKVAQALANLAELAALPIKISTIVANKQLAASNRALIASRLQDTVATEAGIVAQLEETSVKNVGLLASIRMRAAIIAQAVAQKAAAVAARLWTGAQWLLNAALTANPIGLVIALVALLAAGIVILWKRSETFRAITTAVFNTFKSVALTVITFVWKVISGFFGDLLKGAAKAFGWVPGLGPKLKAASKWFGDFTGDVNKKLAGLKDQEIGFTIKYSSTGVNLTTPSSVGRSKAGGKVKGNGSPEVDKYHYLLAPTEWVIRGKASQKYGDYAMGSVNRGTATIIPDSQPGGLAAGGRAGVTLKPSGDANAITRGVRQGITAAVSPVLRSLATNRLAGTIAWGKGQAGKPYGWGASGPASYDCSGFVGALVNYAYGRSPYRRLGATGSMPWASMGAGTGPFMIGYFKGNPGHTAATINGINFESAGGVGTRFGPRARGAYDRMFTNQRKVKGFALGGRPGRGREGFDGDLPFDLLNPRGSSFLGRDFLKEVGMFDNGGVASGTGLIAKGTIAPERMLDPQTTRAFEELVQWLRGNGGGGGGPQVHNHFPATTGAAAEEAAARFLASLGGS